MHGMFERIRKSEEGLTLIELIVVVAIIGVLAWLIVPRVLQALEKSKFNSTESTANELYSAMERYGTEHSAVYPLDTAGFDLDGSGAVAGAEIFGDDDGMIALGRELQINLSRPDKYLDDADPYGYASNATGTNYCIHLITNSTWEDMTSDDFWITPTGVVNADAAPAGNTDCNGL